MLSLFSLGGYMKENTILDELELKDGKYILILKNPIQHGKESITQLELIEPKAKHLKMIPASVTTGDMLKVVGALCSQPDSVIDELSLKDLGKATDFFEAFS